MDLLNLQSLRLEEFIGMAVEVYFEDQPKFPRDVNRVELNKNSCMYYRWGGDSHWAPIRELRKYRDWKLCTQKKIFLYQQSHLLK